MCREGHGEGGMRGHNGAACGMRGVKGMQAEVCEGVWGSGGWEWGEGGSVPTAQGGAPCTGGAIAASE